MLLILRRLGPKSDSEKRARTIHIAKRTFTRFAWFPILAMWISLGDNFQEAYVKECKQEVHDSNSCSGIGVLLQDVGHDMPTDYLTDFCPLDSCSVWCWNWKRVRNTLCPEARELRLRPSGTDKPMDDGRNTSRDSPLVPLGLLSTSQSYRQPYPDGTVSKDSWAFGRYEKTVKRTYSRHALVIEPPDVPAPSEGTVPEVIHPVQCGVAPKGLLLPHSDDEILSGIVEDVSSIRDGYTARSISDPATAFERHSANKRSAEPIYRDVCDRWHLFSSQKCFDNNLPNRLLEQTSWAGILDLRWGRAVTIEEHIAGKWHVMTLQEAIWYFQHECLSNHLSTVSLVVRSLSIRTLFTRTSKSIPFTSTTPWSGWWTLRTVISRASFRRIPRKASPIVPWCRFTSTILQRSVALERTCCLRSVL